MYSIVINGSSYKGRDYKNAGIIQVFDVQDSLSYEKFKYADQTDDWFKKASSMLNAIHKAYYGDYLDVSNSSNWKTLTDDINSIADAKSVSSKCKNGTIFNFRFYTDENAQIYKIEGRLGDRSLLYNTPKKDGQTKIDNTTIYKVGDAVE
jgi:hypothetical protein